jgi:hypothetical protein
MLIICKPCTATYGLLHRDRMAVSTSG